MGHLYHSYLKLSEGNNGIVWDNTAINLPGNNTYGTIALRCVVEILVLQNLSQSLPSRFCIITNAIFIDHTHFHKASSSSSSSSSSRSRNNLIPNTSSVESSLSSSTVVIYPVDRRESQGAMHFLWQDRATIRISQPHDSYLCIS